MGPFAEGLHGCFFRYNELLFSDSGVQLTKLEQTLTCLGLLEGVQLRSGQRQRCTRQGGLFPGPPRAAVSPNVSPLPWSFWGTSLSPEAMEGPPIPSHLISMETRHPYHSQNSKSFRNRVPGIRDTEHRLTVCISKPH